jgi:hypothetical protein
VLSGSVASSFRTGQLSVSWEGDDIVVHLGDEKVASGDVGQVLHELEQLQVDVAGVRFRLERLFRGMPA